MIPLAAFVLPLASPGLADGQRFSAALRCNLKEKDMSKKPKAAAKKQKLKEKHAGAGRLPRKDRGKVTKRLSWQGITVAVSYEPDWLLSVFGQRDF